MRSKPAPTKPSIEATAQRIGPKTINLTRIKEDNHLDRMLQKEFTYDQDIERRLEIKREYIEQKLLVDELYDEKHLRRNWCLVEGVNKFVEKSLDLRGNHLFETEREQIFGEILILDMQTSDHALTFDMIEKSLKKLVNNLHVVRLRASSIKKKGIPELLEQTKQSKRVFLLIEEAECLSRVLTETLVGHLRNRLSDESSPTTTIMVLFCLSSRMQVLPFDNIHVFGRMKGLVKDSSLANNETLDALMRCWNLKVKLGPLTVEQIYDYTTVSDPSLTHVKYLHNNAIFEHYQILENELDKQRPNLEKLEKNHQFLCDQIYVFTKFLADKDSWCEKPTDIYNVFEKHNDLSQSAHFVDAITSIKKFPYDSLVRRLDEIEQEFYDKCSSTKKDKHDVVSILMSYKEKIVNNKDCQEILNQLIHDLIKHAQALGNPLADENMYFDFKLRRILTCSRGLKQTLDLYLDESTYFGVLFKLIQQSPGIVSASDLFDEVVDVYKEMIQLERQAKSIKPSPKKRPRRQTKVMTEKVNLDNGQKTEDELDGLAKAIFVDVIDCMEHQGIVKIDPKSKGKVVKKMAWPEESSF